MPSDAIPKIAYGHPIQVDVDKEDQRRHGKRSFERKNEGEWIDLGPG